MDRFLLLICAVIAVALPAVEPVDPALPEYRSESAVIGKVVSIGSDSLNNLMTFWAEGIQERHPALRVEIEGKGGSTAPATLLSGSANIGTMTRRMRDDEIAPITAAWGYAPTAIAVAVDALAVFVHPDNPIPSLTLQQLDAIFSSTCLRRGISATTWGDLGLSGEWATRSLTPVGRNPASGSYGYFKWLVLAKGEFTSSVVALPGLRGVVAQVASDLVGIGYTGVGYIDAGVRAVPLVDGDAIPVLADAVTSRDGSYPLARRFYLYARIDPARPGPTRRWSSSCVSCCLSPVKTWWSKTVTCP